MRLIFLMTQQTMRVDIYSTAWLTLSNNALQTMKLNINRIRRGIEMKTVFFLVMIFHVGGTTSQQIMYKDKEQCEQAMKQYLEPFNKSMYEYAQAFCIEGEGK